MAPVERECDPTFGDSRCYVRYQPKGVVGNMAPWNFPADISLGPLVDILAAGNRAIVKPSECAPHSAELVRQAVAKDFDPSLVTVVTGEAHLAQAFAGARSPHVHRQPYRRPARVMASARRLSLPRRSKPAANVRPLAPDRVTEDTIAEVLALKASRRSGLLNTDYLLVPEKELERVFG
jgi:coniferyl-aldehyde dehydrogenase